MKILGITSSSKVASVAILENNKIIGSKTICDEKTHSVKLMPMVNELFKELNLTPSDIDLLACDIGPGSFTGLRIGIASINAMATCLNKPCIGISSLLALAYNIKSDDELICSLIDAKHDNVYYAVFDKNYNNIIEYNSGNILDMLNLLPQNKKIIFVGEYEEYKSLIKEKYTDYACFTDDNLNSLNATCIVNAAFDNNNSASFSPLKPMYLRKSQAERGNDGN